MDETASTFLISQGERIRVTSGAKDALSALVNRNVTTVLLLYPRENTGAARVDCKLFSDRSSNDTLCVLDVSLLYTALTSPPASPPVDGGASQAHSKMFLLSLCLARSLVVYSELESINDLLKCFQGLRSLCIGSIATGSEGESAAVKNLLDSSLDILILSSSSTASSKPSSKQIIDAFLGSEQGFSEEAALRNELRRFISGFTSNVTASAVSQADAAQVGPAIVTKPDIMEKMLSRPKPVVDGFRLTGPMAHRLAECTAQALDEAVQSSSVSYSTIAEGRAKCLQTVIGEGLVKDCFNMYSEQMHSAIDRFKSAKEFEEYHRSVRSSAIVAFSQAVEEENGWTSSAVAYKKRLQGSIRELRDSFQSRVEQAESEAVAFVYDKNREILRSAKIASQDATMSLQDAGGPYNRLVAFKSVLEKYANVCSSELKADGKYEGKSLKVSEEQLAKVYTEELDEIIVNCRLWVKGYEGIVQTHLKTRAELVDTLGKMQAEDEEVTVRMEREEREAAELLKGLENVLACQRTQQGAELEAKTSKVEGLTDRLDRAHHLNEKEKNDAQSEIMSIQAQIQEIQEKCLEMRHERESQTDKLHRKLLESEREGHAWFKSAIAKQHTLLEQELSLEREISARRNSQMNAKFVAEADHMREIENTRLATQRIVQDMREERLSTREKVAREHEAQVSRLRAQLSEVDSKLHNTASSDHHPGDNNSGDKDEKKKCVVM